MELPNKTVTDRDEIVSWVEKYLKHHNTVELRAFIQTICPDTMPYSEVLFVRDIAARIQATGKLLCKENDDPILGGTFQFKTYYVTKVPKKTYSDRHPYVHAGIVALIGGVIGFGFSQLADVLKGRSSNNEQHQIDSLQSMKIDSLKSSIHQLQSVKVDSATK